MNYLVWCVVIIFSISLPAFNTDASDNSVVAPCPEDIIPNGVFYLLSGLTAGSHRDIIQFHSAQLMENLFKKLHSPRPAPHEVRVLSYLLEKKIWFKKKPCFLERNRRELAHVEPVPSSHLTKEVRNFLLQLDDDEIDFYLQENFAQRNNFLMMCLVSVLVSIKFYDDEATFCSNLIDEVNQVFPDYLELRGIVKAEVFLLKSIGYKVFFDIPFEKSCRKLVRRKTMKFYVDEETSSSDLVSEVNQVFPGYLEPKQAKKAEAFFLKRIERKLFFDAPLKENRKLVRKNTI